MSEQRRMSSWSWRKFKRSSGSAKSLDKSSHFSPSPLTSPASSFKAEESSRSWANWKQEATTSAAAAIDEEHVLEAISLREQAEESLRSLKQELTAMVNELSNKDALVKQHQKVADEAVSGREKAEKHVVSLTTELETFSQQKIALEDRVLQLDGALKECMREVRHVRDEQEGKILEAITCKAKEFEKVKTEADARHEELRRRLMESDAQKSAMARSMQERAGKIIEVSEARANAEVEVKALQVKLGSSEKEVSGLRYELQLLSKQLEIRNEEVDYCKKSADAAHEQHLENVRKVTKLEADCHKLRLLLQKKRPGPAAIAQMRKEVEGLPRRSENTAGESRTRQNRSYARSTISFTNSHQSVLSRNLNRDGEFLRERLSSMEEENKLLKEALSKRIGELQASWLLCAKTANKLSITEDQLESLQGTPRGLRVDSFATTTEPSIASISVEDGNGSLVDDEEASCAESWASALIGELAHLKKSKPTTKEVIKEDCMESDTMNVPSMASHEEISCDQPLVLTEQCSCFQNSADREMSNAVQDGQLQTLCKDLDHKLNLIKEQLRSRGNSGIESTTTHHVEESMIPLVNAAHEKLSDLERAIQGIIPSSMQASRDPVCIGVVTTSLGEGEMRCREVMLDTSDAIDADDKAPSIDEEVESHAGTGEDAKAPWGAIGAQVEDTAMDEHVMFAACTNEDVLAATSIASSTPEDSNASRQAICSAIVDAETQCEWIGPIPSSSLSFVLCKLISLLEMLPPKHTLTKKDATLDAGCTEERPEEVTRGNAGGPAQHICLEQQKRVLVSCKDSFMEGKSSVLDFLVQMAIMLSAACHVESCELQDVVGRAEVGLHVNAAGFLSQGPTTARQLQGELERDVAGGASARTKEEMLKGVKEGLACQEEGRHSKAEVLEEAEADVAQLQASVTSLTQKLEQQKELHKEVMAKCEELQLKVQSYELQDDKSYALKPSEREDTQLKKESELAAANEKLAECQRTIKGLGKQLDALSKSSSAHHLHPSSLEDALSCMPATAFDHRSRGGQQDGHFTPPRISTSSSSHHLQYPHHNHSVHADTKSTMAFSIPRHHRQRADTTSHQLCLPPKRQLQNEHYQNGRQRADMNQPRQRKGSASAGQLQEYMQQQQLCPVHVAHYPASKGRRQQQQQQNNDVRSYPASWQQRSYDEGQVTLTRLYSPGPSMSAMSSPARSPGRYVRQVGCGREAAMRGNAVRMNLTESLKAAAPPAHIKHPSTTKPAAPPTSTSTFGRLFSRSKQSR